jgi:ParB-like chromosome segregation protein Spo0J
VSVRQIALEHSVTSSDSLLALRDAALRDTRVEWVPISDLVVSFTPRVGGTDLSYAAELSDLVGELPPILVHRPTMIVIDGRHRLQAAQLEGRRHIAARFFEGSRQDAALLSVAVNVAQGRPLSLADRVAAAERLFASHPDWSDRAVAAVVGLSPKKTAAVRRRATATRPGERRLGLDGRSRPLNTADARELADRLLREDPRASLRTIAREAGLSPATVADVRNRISRGEHPVPARLRGRVTGPAARPQPGRETAPRPDTAPRPETETRSVTELPLIFDSLRRDPSLRLNDTGRAVLRMLDACALVARDRQRITAQLPPHCKRQMSELMNGYAEVLRVFAHDLCSAPHLAIAADL